MQKFVKEYVPYIVIIILVLLIKRYVVTPIRVNGPSMLPTLKDKDKEYVDKHFKDLEEAKDVAVKIMKGM